MINTDEMVEIDNAAVASVLMIEADNTGADCCQILQFKTHK